MSRILTPMHWRNLGNIRRINRLLGWTSYTVRGVAAAVRARHLRSFSPLDLASGSADTRIATEGLAGANLFLLETQLQPNKRRLKKLRKLQRIVSRRKKGSTNRKKAVRKLAKLHRQIKNQRHNTLHQVTTRLAKTTSVLVIEDLYVAGMLKNHHLAQAIGDVGFAEFKRQLLYKASWYGARVLLADRWEPSSKRCSGCGWLDADLTLSDRTFHCAQCGPVLDRDLNAAINLEKLAGSLSDSLNACGVASSGAKRKPRVQLAAEKQELNTKGGVSTFG